jgi:predicted anti-sigma-YlaC factor YlaD
MAISARLDREDPGVPGDLLRGHLDNCADCRAWEQRAHVVTRRARLGGLALDHDLAPGVLAALPALDSPRRRPVAPRAGLVVAALAQLAVTVPLLILGHDHDAGTHAAHELGSFDLALAIAFLVGAVRPRLSAGLAWPCVIAALGLAGTAIADMIAGQTFGADEAQHLVAVAGAALLFWQARTGPTGPVGYAPETAVPAVPAVSAGQAQVPDESAEWPDERRPPSSGPAAAVA